MNPKVADVVESLEAEIVLVDRTLGQLSDRRTEQSDSRLAREQQELVRWVGTELNVCRGYLRQALTSLGKAE